MLICESKDLKKEEPRLRCWVHCSHYLIFGCAAPLYQNLYLGFLQNTIYDFSNGWVPFMPAPPLICQPVVLSESMLLFLLPRVVSRDLSIVSWHPVLILLLNPWDSWWRCRLISIIIGDQSVVDLTCCRTASPSWRLSWSSCIPWGSHLWTRSFVCNQL